MKCGYDNLEDTKQKLVGTYCMYSGKAVVVKVVEEIVPTNSPNFRLLGSYLFNGRAFECNLDDPLFNCSEFNIGYVNRLSAAVWWYRLPMKQWQQGLKQSQLNTKYSNRAYVHGFEFRGKPVAQMLENAYPNVQEASDLLTNQEAQIVAFHKNFAMTRDEVYKGFTVEYKGEVIGSTFNLKEFNLLNERQHLIEALKEAAA